jgi:predicted Rossmann fold nucleotide-binding protein DprA/Smf involved in DNA uptake
MDSIIAASDPSFPPSLGQRLGQYAPQRLALLGDPALLSRPALGICCGPDCPDPLSRLIASMSQAANNAGLAVISGFQTPPERDWMMTSLQGGKGSAIVVSGQPVEISRLPSQWRQLVEARRLLVVQPITGIASATDGILAQYAAVAALCRALLLTYAPQSGDHERLAQVIRLWPLPLLTTRHTIDASLVALGAQAIAPDELVPWWSARFS